MHLYAQNGLQSPQRVESTSSMHFRYRKKMKLTPYCDEWWGGGGTGSKYSKIQDGWIIWV